MSAWIVSREHINVIIHAGLEAGQEYHSDLRWKSQDQSTPTVENGLTDEGHWGRYRALNHQTADVVGQILLSENVRSVNYRYNEETVEELYTYQRPRTTTWGPVEVIKAIHCLNYQSCETDDWEQSEAFTFLEALTSNLLHRLPGYDGAPWGIDEDTQSAYEVESGIKAPARR